MLSRQHLAITAACLALQTAFAQPNQLTKHTVAGAGTFESEGVWVRAPINRATLQLAGGVCALTVAGRMCWVLVGPWTLHGSEIAMKITTVNNARARGTGTMKLDSRAQIAALKFSGSMPGGSYRLTFKSGAPAPLPAHAPAPREKARPARVAMAPLKVRKDVPIPTPIAKPIAHAASRHTEAPAPLSIELRASAWGTGPLRRAGHADERIGFATVHLDRSGRASVQLGVRPEALNLQGSWKISRNSEALLTLHPAGGTDPIAGSIHLNGAGFSRLVLKGRLDGRAFSAHFDSQQTRR